MNCECNMYFESYVTAICVLLRSLDVQVFKYVGDGSNEVVCTVHKRDILFLNKLIGRDMKCPHGFYKIVKIKPTEKDSEKFKLYFKIIG